MLEEDLTPDGEQDPALEKKYGDILRKEREQVPLQRSMQLAPTMEPQKSAEVIELSKKTGWERDAVEQNFDKIKTAVKTPTPNYLENLRQDAPKTATWLEDKHNAAATLDDVELLKRIEGNLKGNDPLLRPLTDAEITKSATEATDRRVKFMLSEERKPIAVYGSGSSMVVQPPTLPDEATLRARILTEELATRRTENAFVTSPKELTAGDVFSKNFAENPVFMLPFLSSAPEIGKAAGLLQAANRAKDNTATPEDIDMLIRHARLEAAMSKRGKDVGGYLTELGMSLPAFVGELALTGGTATAAKEAAIGTAKTIARKALGKVVEIGVHTALSQGLRIGTNTFLYGTPDTAVTQDDKGELQIQVSDDKGASMAVPFMKAVASSLIDVSAAHIPFHPAFKFWASKTPGATVDGFLKTVAKGGVESALGGIAINDATKLAKELVGLAGPVEMPDTLKAMMGDTQAMKRVAAAVGGFGLMGALGSSVQRSRVQAQLQEAQASGNQTMFRELSQNVKDMAAQTSHPEVVADSIKAMVKDTPQEFTKVPADVFFDHYQKLGIDAAKFAEELTGKPAALSDAIERGGMLQIPTDQYLTKIGATDAGPVFEKAGATFDPNIQPPDEVKQKIKELDKAQEAQKKAPKTAEDLKFEDTVKALGDSFQARAKEQGIDLAKYVDQNNVESAQKVAARLHASTAAVDAAKENIGQSKPLLAGVPELAMNPKDTEAYGKLIKESQAAAHGRLDAEALADINRDRKKVYAMHEAEVRARLTKEVEALPEYRALSIMETGSEPDGTPVPEALGGIKFDRSEIKELYGQGILDALPRKIIAKASEAGVHRDIIADVLGFSSGDELVQKMAGLENKEAVIDRRTDEVMAKMNLQELEELPQKAKEAIHNDQEVKVKAFQLKWLLENRLPQMKELLGRVSNPKQYAKETLDYAREKIGKGSDRENDPREFERNERRANKLAREALLSGDLPEAAKQMDLEVLNHQMYRASIEARNDARRIRDFAAEFSKSDKRKLLYAAGEEYLAQADDFLDRFSFKKQSDIKIEKLKSLKDFADNESNQGYISQIPEKLLKESYRQNWRDMPIDTLREVERTLTQLANNATLKNTLSDGREKRDTNDLAGEVAKQIRSSKKKLEKPIDSFDSSEEAKRTRKDLLLSPRNDAALYREMDGFKDGGIMQQVFSRRMNEAGTHEAQLNEKATMALDKIYGKFSAFEKLAMLRKQFVPEVSGSLNGYQRMEIAAILGQKGARQRFLDGRQWGPRELKAITDGLSEKQWQWVKEVHEFLKTYEPDVKAQIERRTGLPAQMVEAEPIETPFGTQEGGYSPFKYDPRYDPETGKKLDIDEAKRSMWASGMQAQTRHGFAEQRMETVKGKRLRFDAGVLFEHLREVNHDIAWSEPLRDMSRLLNHKEVASAITEHYGDQVHRQLTNSLHDIAVGDKPAANAWEKGLNWLRQGSTTAALGWSFMQAATDMTGLSQGAVRIGPKWMAEGAKKVLGDAVHMENAFKEMMDRSEMMRLRAKTSMRELNEVRNQVQKQGMAAMVADLGLEKLTGGKVDVKDIHDSYYYMMTKVQLAQEGPLWWGAMERAKSEHPLATDASPKDAIKLHDKWVSIADQAVLDTYGGGQTKDLAPIQKGGAIQKLLFSTFYSFANRTLNLAIEKNIQFFRGPKTAGTVGRYAADMVLLYTLPALATFAIKNIVTGNDQELGKRFLQDQAGYIAGSVPVLREAAPIAIGRDYSGPAGLRFFSAAASVGKAAWQGKMDWHDLNQAAGILFHYPALQLQRTIDGLEALMGSDRGTPLSPLFGPPPKKAHR